MQIKKTILERFFLCREQMTISIQICLLVFIFYDPVCVAVHEERTYKSNI
jgi:hypothetical protein